MKYLAYSTNQVLFQHLQAIANGDKKVQIIGGIRRTNVQYFTDIVGLKVFKKRKIFVYNVSPTNLLISIFSSLSGSKVIFHLHDPKPHSGFLNPIIYVLQLLQVLISYKIFVFDQSLVTDAKHLYPVRSSKFRVVNHGSPNYVSVETGINTEVINFGFFGRNMPYKDVSRFVKLADKFKQHQFHIFGSGYDERIITGNNIHLNNEFIDNDLYYSAMAQMDYVVVPYKDISFSGIIFDGIALNKHMLVSLTVQKKYNFDKMTLLSEFNEPRKQRVAKGNRFGWSEYRLQLDKEFL